MNRQNLTVALFVAIFLVATNTITCLIWQHQAVVHHAASFESNSWGLTRFIWEDTACAHEQNQVGWEKIQEKLFNDKLTKLGIPNK